MFSRFDQASLIALKTFGSLLTKSGWERCVVALTKANVPPMSMRNAADGKLKMTELTEDIKKQMQNHYFSQRGLLEISQKIPFVPVGCVTEDADERAILGSSDSIQDLVNQCMLHCKPPSVSVKATTLYPDRRSHRSIASIVLCALCLEGYEESAAVGKRSRNN